MGIIVTFRGVDGIVDVSMQVSEHRKLFLRRVSQGVVITLIGAASLIGALYLLTEKRSERQVKGKEITIEHGSGNERIKNDRLTRISLSG